MVLTCNFQQGLYIPTTRRQQLRQKNKNKNKKTKNPVGLVGKNKKIFTYITLICTFLCRFARLRRENANFYLKL